MCAALATLVMVASQSAMAESAAAPAAEQQGEDLERQLRNLEKQIEDLQRELERLRSASGAVGASESRLSEIERRIEALGRDLEALRVGQAAEVKAEGSVYGFGPAASKVYKVKRGLSVGGYGEMLYQNLASERDDGAAVATKDSADFLRAVLYFGYKFSDRIVFNSEIEFEHATTGSGSADKGEVSVEFAYLDFLVHPTFNVRTGLLLVPLGFVNELHEPPLFHGARRPEVETQLIPTTWRENGAGIFGGFGPWSYRLYALAGLDPAGIDVANLRSSRQQGSRSSAEDIGVAARFDLSGVPGLLAGASVFTGETGQNAEVPFDGGRVTLLDVHADWKWKGLELRGLWMNGIIGDVDAINAASGVAAPSSVGERWRGWYAQVAYDVLAPLEGTEQQLFPFVRYEEVDTQHRVPGGAVASAAADRRIFTGGLTYKPIPNVAVKADYQNFDDEAESGVDQFNLAVGYLF